MDWRSIRELWRQLDQCLGDEHRDRVEVARDGFKPEPLCFEWDRSAAAEWVDNGGRPVGIPPPNLGSWLLREPSRRLTLPTEPAAR